jgi:hypothetical protein
MIKAFVLSAVVAFALCGCAGPGLTLSASEGDIPLCTGGQSPIPVETLNTSKNAQCKIADTDLLFPDGTLVHIDSGAYSGSQTGGPAKSPKLYTYISAGIYGFVVGTADGSCRHTAQWGTPSGKAKVADAFGKNWQCPTK